MSITVRDATTLDGVGSNRGSSGIKSVVGSKAVGNGGTLTLNTGSLTVTNGAQLTASMFGRGDAGDVLITVRDAAAFDGVGSDGFPSFAGSTVDTVEGNGGTLTLKTGSLKVTNGAQLSASTSGKGDAGDVSITVRDAATFDGVGSNRGPSFAGSIVESTALGNGGILTLETGSLNITNGAVLSSESRGQGDAGEIVLRVRDTLRMENGTIATSSSRTAGGKIDISGIVKDFVSKGQK